MTGVDTNWGRESKDRPIDRQQILSCLMDRSRHETERESFILRAYLHVNLSPFVVEILFNRTFRKGNGVRQKGIKKWSIRSTPMYICVSILLILL